MARMSKKEIDERVNAIVNFVKKNQPCTVYDLSLYLNRSAWTARAWIHIAAAKDPRLVYQSGVLYYKEAGKREEKHG